MQKYVNLVDLVKSFPTSIYLQKSASIQSRTSLSKFGGKSNSIFIRLLKDDAPLLDVGEGALPSVPSENRDRNRDNRSVRRGRPQAPVVRDVPQSGVYDVGGEVEAKHGVPIVHETHRQRLLHSPYQARAATTAYM